MDSNKQTDSIDKRETSNNIQTKSDDSIFASQKDFELAVFAFRTFIREFIERTTEQELNKKNHELDCNDDQNYAKKLIEQYHLPLRLQLKKVKINKSTVASTYQNVKYHSFDNDVYVNESILKTEA